MSLSQQSFIERIYHLGQSLDEGTLNDSLPSDTGHNNIAKLLRNGLAVVGFVAIEDFIKKRTGEVLSEIGATGVSFTALPQKLRYSVTVEVLQALSRIVKYEPKEDAITLIQGEAIKISSTSSTPYNLTEYAFGYKTSNISSDDIKSILTAFSIPDGWGNMSKISSRIGLTGLPLKNSFENATLRRNNAAHVAQSNIPINDLRQYVLEAYGIAISFDSLITKALSIIKERNTHYLSDMLNITDTMIKLSFIKFEGGTWKYKRENIHRSFRNDTNKDSLINSVKSRAEQQNETLIIYDESGNITKWFCF